MTSGIAIGAAEGIIYKGQQSFSLKYYFNTRLGLCVRSLLGVYKRKVFTKTNILVEDFEKLKTRA